MSRVSPFGKTPSIIAYLMFPPEIVGNPIYCEYTARILTESLHLLEGYSG
jgi:hypothetical protein